VKTKEKKVKRHLMQTMALFGFALLVGFAPAAQAQDQSSTAAPSASSSGSSAASAQTKPQATAQAEEAESGSSAAAEALQKATQNPVASLISLPVQDNTNFGVNPGYRNQNVLNIQPVILIGISKD
jgi:hypothetical protein